MISTEKNSFKAEHGALIYAFAILALICLQVVCAFLLTAVKARSESGYKIAANITGIILQGGNAFVFIMVLRKYNTAPDIFIPQKIKPSRTLVWGIGAGAFCGLLCLLSFYPLVTLYNLFLEFIGYNMDSALYMDNAPQIIFAILSACVLAPVFEELIYRSALLSGLNKTFKGKYASVFICAAAFSLMHMNPLQTVYQFCLGLSCAFLAVSTRSVLPSIAAHLISNLTVILAELTFLGRFFIMYDRLLDKSLAITFIVALALAAEGGAAIFFICKLLKNKTDEAETVAAQARELAAAVETEPVIATVRIESKQAEFEKYSTGLRKISYPRKLILLGLGISSVMWIATFITNIIS